MMRYPWADVRLALLALEADRPDVHAVQVTYVNPETGADVESNLGFHALVLGPGQVLRLPVRSPACVFHLIEGRVQASVGESEFTLETADTCCAPGYTEVRLRNHDPAAPSFLCMADESPFHRKLGVYETRG